MLNIIFMYFQVLISGSSSLIQRLKTIQEIICVTYQRIQLHWYAPISLKWKVL